MNYLILDDLRFHAFHGVIPTENIVGGEYSVSLKIGYDFSKAAQSDDINDAINYAVICDLIKREMEQSSKLIENVAWRVQQAIMEAFPQIRTLETTVRKIHPPVPYQMAASAVELHYERG